MLQKVISGYQTGADRAGVHAAFALGIKTGGWVPRDRRSDDGPIPFDIIERYGLAIHPGNGYPPRTEQNVMDSDGTVLFGYLDSPGCRTTLKACSRHRKPFLCVEASELVNDIGTCIVATRLFIMENAIETMNVAGNRERLNPGIYGLSYSVIHTALEMLS